MARFEFVKKYADAGLELPSRGTQESAGYDLTVAEDIVIPRFEDYGSMMLNEWADREINKVLEALSKAPTVELPQLAAITKISNCKPTLVPTGVKCYLDPGQYLELSVRSSTPLKYWLILANGVGIIDADYADNLDNEGHIFLQLINLSPFNIQLRKGDKIGQAIIKHYDTAENDFATGKRVGGFGSTTEEIPHE